MQIKDTRAVSGQNTRQQSKPILPPLPSHCEGRGCSTCRKTAITHPSVGGKGNGEELLKTGFVVSGIGSPSLLNKAHT